MTVRPAKTQINLGIRTCILISTELYQIRQTEILATVKDTIWINNLFQLNACIIIVLYRNVAHNFAKSSKLMLMKQL